MCLNYFELFPIKFEVFFYLSQYFHRGKLLEVQAQLQKYNPKQSTAQPIMIINRKMSLLNRLVACLVVHMFSHYLEIIFV